MCSNLEIKFERNITEREMERLAYLRENVTAIEYDK